MGRHADLDQDIARRSTIRGRFSLTTETYFFAVINACWYFHMECFAAAIGPMYDNLCLATGHGGREGDRQFVL